MSAFRSFRDQSLHYFSRNHTHIPEGKIESPAAWRGEDMRTRTDDWLTILSADELDEIEAAADHALTSGLALEEITRSAFALPTLSQKIETWRQEIAHGRGFVVVRGLPVADWGEEKAAYAYWGLGHHLGLPGAQNPQNELLGHVVDYGEEADNPMVRRYRTTGNIDFHCDAADAVGLLCLHTAKSGGQSRIVSSVAIFNEIVDQRRDLIERLFDPIALDLRGEERPGDAGYISLPPCRYTEEAGLKTFYHSEYFRSATRHEDVQHDPATADLLDLYDTLCLRPDLQLDMWLEPGDIQFISNHTTVHSRTEYEDWPERERKRHLLRLWLSL
ncbi:MAG: TauD/TfdA family dioxygenase [Henriciella sp.]|nr:TauD/TfdA family dioxygenase [Henriciella sp.]